MEKKLKKDISNLRLEKQRLKNSYDLQAKESLEKDIRGEDTDALIQELKEEKEKVKNLTSWKEQLMIKNRELKEDNERSVR